MPYRIAVLVCLLVSLSSANAETPAGSAGKMNADRDSPANAQSFNSAVQRALAAMKKGDYAAVLREMMPFAERGNADGQTIVGSLYDRGNGVPQSYTQAVMWNRRAAEQGNDAGQYYLGVMYGLGRGGLREDRVTSHMWLSLAAAQGNGDAAKARDKIADFMTPAQLAEAKKRVSAWKPVKAPR
jgi:TPR repeat protein